MHFSGDALDHTGQLLTVDKLQRLVSGEFDSVLGISATGDQNCTVCTFGDHYSEKLPHYRHANGTFSPALALHNKSFRACS
jgi:hypothetical protein